MKDCGSPPKLGGGFKKKICSPRKLEKISNLTHIFQMGWFNHQPQNVHVFHPCERNSLGAMASLSTPFFRRATRSLSASAWAMARRRVPWHPADG